MELFNKEPLDPVSKRRLYALLDYPDMMNEAEDKEVKQLYDSLKHEAFADNESKRFFRKIGKSIKKMVKGDKKRSRLIRLKKYLKCLIILFVALLPLNIYMDRYHVYLPNQTSEIFHAIRYNAEMIYDYAPNTYFILKILVTLLIGFIIVDCLLRRKDGKLISRVHCKAIGEGMTMNDMIRLKRRVMHYGVSDTAWFHPLREYGKRRSDDGSDDWGS